MDTGAQVYRWAAQDIPRKGLYRIFLYKIQPNQFYTVLLYNRGTEPQTILFYHTDEVQVPQVPRM